MENKSRKQHMHILSTLDREREYKDPPLFGYETSTRNAPGDDTLRELLLRVHDDPKLAEFIKESRYIVYSIYDTDRNCDYAPVLSWKSKENKVGWIYKQPSGSAFRPDRSTSFELIDGKFYAHKKELLIHFPELTTNMLTEGIERAIQEDYEFKREIARKKR